MHTCAKFIQPVTEPIAHPRGHVHIERPVGSLRQNCCGERGVPTRCNRERWPLRQEPQLLGSSEVEQDREEESRLLTATHSPGFVLDPDTTASGQTELVGKERGSRKRRGDKAGIINDTDCGVEFLDQLVPACSIHAMRVGEGSPRQVLVVGGKCVRLPLGRINPRTAHDLQDVAPVSGCCVWTAECERRRNGNLGAARGAAPSDHGHPRVVHVRVQRFQPAATCALKSSIMPSQTPVYRRNPRQKSWERRASNRSNGVPCCSTQV